MTTFSHEKLFFNHQFLSSKLCEEKALGELMAITKNTVESKKNN